MLLTYFPTVMSRYAVAASYGGLFIALFPKLKRNRKFIFTLIIGIMIVFPMLNAFRYASISDVDVGSALEQSFSNLPFIWQHGDFDAYTLLLMSLEHTEKLGSTHGWQLFNSLMFWWPRVLWPKWLPEKTRGSGDYLARTRGMSFTNLSCPLPAEGNINFGIIGVVAFGLVFGAIVGAIDRCYWKNPENTYFSVIYPTLMFMFFFMSRGDLMLPLAYTISFVAVRKLLVI